jgi:2-methylisocitrate lyase-like PEP mutase family enzyme
MLEASRTIVAPSAYDPLSAKIIQKIGFDAVHASGNSLSGRLGIPDAGLITMVEMLENVRYIVASVDLPVIVDIDDGYGNALNVYRTIKLLEKAGAAGAHIEDQVHPKKYSFFPGKRELVPIKTMVGKIKAAKKASKDFFLIARTEGPGTGHTIEESLERLKAYADAGADAVLCITTKFEDYKLIRETLPDTPIVGGLNMHLMMEGYTIDDLKRAGCSIIFIASIQTGLLHAAKAFWDSLMTLKTKGTIKDIVDRMMPLDQFYELVGWNEYAECEKEFVL